ncbi:hypothetical protein [Pseudomonas sp. F1002]|uniref:hypothetical protein n=1 Tax=Pseudomonas sp. F1002 TaxID=2738821 RepID=UPI0015A16B29|nr:hypothetical protein [Pseudomonas sp. F1002]NWB62360.1 hypothetical protein [Pseudomonas sp. F1002]
MTTYATLNPVLPTGSTDPRDLKDNAENFDVAVNAPNLNWVDRLGVIRLSWAGLEKQFANFLLNQGFQFLGDYASGPITIGAQNQVFSRNGNYYRPGPSLVLPYTTVSNWAIDEPKFLVAGDGVLRNELTSTALDKGISLLPGGQRLVSTVAVLKTMPSTTPATEVKLSRYRTGGPIINSEYEADFSDTTTVADDFVTIRTATGLLYRLKHTGMSTYQAAGAVGDDATNDADAMDRFHASTLNLAGIGKFMTSRGLTFPSPAGRSIEGVPGQFKIRSQSNTNHEVTFRSQSPVNLKIVGLEVDANSFNRTGVLTTRTMAIEINSGTDCDLTDCVARNVIGSSSGIPGVGIATSGSGVRVNTLRCKAFDCGTIDKPADGFFCSSSYSVNTDNYAENCFDTGGVVESCSYSGFTKLRSKNCGAGGAISNAVGFDTYGCWMDVEVENWRSSVTGGVQFLCSAAGGLLDCSANVTMSAPLYGIGPAVNFRETGTGRINGFSLWPRIRGGSGTNQGILGSGIRIQINAPAISGANDSSIQFQGASTVTVMGGEITGGLHSMAALGTARIVANDTQCVSPTAWCMYAYDSSSIFYNGVVPFNPGAGYAGKDAAATISMIGGLSGGIVLPSALAGAATGSQSSKFPVYGPAGQTLGFVPLYPS